MHSFVCLEQSATTVQAQSTNLSTRPHKQRLYTHRVYATCACLLVDSRPRSYKTQNSIICLRAESKGKRKDDLVSENAASEQPRQRAQHEDRCDVPLGRLHALHLGQRLQPAGASLALAHNRSNGPATIGTRASQHSHLTATI